MISSDLMTIFGDPPRSRVIPSPFVVSLLVHGTVFGVLTANLLHQHRIIERFPAGRFAVRVLDFHSTAPQREQMAGGALVYRGPVSAAPAAASSGAPSAAREIAQRMPAPQTLIQPDLPHDVLAPPKTPVPLVVLWSPEQVVPRKVILPPLPEKPVIAVVHPALDTPIPEENLAELRVASTPTPALRPSAPPGTTSPVVVHGPEKTQKVPETTSQHPEPPTPARVVSLSDVRVAEGRVTIPMANETSPKTAPGTTIPGQLQSPLPRGNGSAGSKSTGAGAAKESADRAGKKPEASPVGSAAAERAANGGQTAKTQTAPGGGRTAAAPAHGPAEAAVSAPAPPNSGIGSGQGSESEAGNGLSAVRIRLPKDGQFGVIVFGSSIEDRYPETAELWSGRLASTVYLHVGLRKSWILQYALPRLADAAVAGSGGHLEAPWPFEIVRPNLDPADVDAEAVILHGYVNKDGRFEKLGVVFPAQLVQASMVVNVINQWQFRPARQDGLLTAVEVLLIIPDQSE